MNSIFYAYKVIINPKSLGPEKISIILRQLKEAQKPIGNAKIYNYFSEKILVTLNFRTVKRCKHLPDLSSFKLFGFFISMHWAIFGNLLCSSAFFRAQQYSKQMRDDVLKIGSS